MSIFLIILHFILVIGFGTRVLLRENLAPDVRVGWLMILLMLPFIGSLLYYLLGEAHIDRRIAKKYQRVEYIAKNQPNIFGDKSDIENLIAPRWQGVFKYAASINGFNPTTGNSAILLRDGKDARDSIINDINNAKNDINILYYIWLPDVTGTNMANALCKAAERGVLCRVIVDGMGSRLLIKSNLWKMMKDAGVNLEIALPLSNILKTIFTSRIDIRNHRKLTIIDNEIAYIGSQNCADESFDIKAKFAPWVDIMLKVRGACVWQAKAIFESDWLQANNIHNSINHKLINFNVPDFKSLLKDDDLNNTFTAQIMCDGPTEREKSTPQLLCTLISAAREKLIISTPYFVPDATVLESLCAAALRGVDVELILPAKNDSWIVAAASRSHYLKLLKNNIKIWEFKHGLLHAKTLTIDNEVSFIGSTNLDLRSFDLNFENDLLIQDNKLTSDIISRQYTYISNSQAVLLNDVLSWSWKKRIFNNALAAMSPVL